MEVGGEISVKGLVWGRGGWMWGVEMIWVLVWSWVEKGGGVILFRGGVEGGGGEEGLWGVGLVGVWGVFEIEGGFCGGGGRCGRDYDWGIEFFDRVY